MSIFSNLPEWNGIGTEPSQTKKDAGWQAGEKPPADWFNWLFNRTYESLIEVDSNANTLDDRVTTAEGDIATAETELDVIDSNADGKVDNADNADNATNVTSTYKDNDIDTNADGKVDNADNADNATNVTSTYKDNDIDTNADGKVDNADNADLLSGKRWVTIALGNTTGESVSVTLKTAGSHVHYNFSVYSTDNNITYDNASSNCAYINRGSTNIDTLVIKNSTGTAYYEVLSWE